MSDRDSGAEIGAFFAGVLIGGLVGAATALLLAPQTGEETRKVIGKTSEEWRDRAQDVLEDARERAVRDPQVHGITGPGLWNVRPRRHRRSACTWIIATVL